MDGEDVLYLAAGRIVLSFGEPGQFTHGACEGDLYALSLGHALRRLYWTPRNSIVLRINDQRLGYRNTVGDGDSFFYFNGSLSLQ